MTPERFLATHHVFARRELEEALSRHGWLRSPRTISSHLLRWTRKGRIEQVKRGLYVRTESEDAGLGLLPVASRTAGDAGLAYHTALEVHGYAQSLHETLYFATWTKTKALTFRGRKFVPVRPPAQLREKGPQDGWVKAVERSGLTLRVTTLERTTVDVLDRLHLAGGLEEVWRSCAAIPGLDLRELEAYVKLLGSGVLAAKVGFFLERHNEKLAVSDALLDRFRSLIPRDPVYMERGRSGRVVLRWNLVAPLELLEGDWEPVA